MHGHRAGARTAPPPPPPRSRSRRDEAVRTSDELVVLYKARGDNGNILTDERLAFVAQVHFFGFFCGNFDLFFWTIPQVLFSASAPYCARRAMWSLAVVVCCGRKKKDGAFLMFTRFQRL